MSASVRSALCLLALFACSKEPKEDPPPAPDVAEVLGEGEVRAGRIADDRALFGGISAEGQVGDFKIYNHLVQFVIQDVRLGSYYLQEGGGVIDADIVRPEGQPGRDLVDEWQAMVGLARMVEATEIEVVRDGSEGGSALIRVKGRDTGLAVLEGALEAKTVPLYGLDIQTEYELQPDSWLMEVRTTITSPEPLSFPVGDLLMGAPEVSQIWSEGLGFGDETGEDRTFTGYIGTRNDVAVAVIGSPGVALAPRGGELLNSVAEMVVAMAGPLDLPEDEPVTLTRYFGVGPDMATLTGAALSQSGIPAETLEGVVQAPDGPVAGARVVISVDGAPYTVAFTGEDGHFSAQVPQGAEATAQADGRGDGLFPDLPPGAGSWSTYAAAAPTEITRSSLREGAPPVPMARGRGVASADAPLTLGQPGRLVVASGDGLPFTVRLNRHGDEPVDLARFQGRPGPTVGGWSRDGEVELLVEPGTYDLLVHRGMRYEAHHEVLEISAGGEGRVDLSLPLALSHPGWIFADPHAHASPSPDGRIPMEDRLITFAAGGVQLHFGTDHDHIADYRPLLDALDLQEWMGTVVADEVSPPIRGHMNVYPLRTDPSLPNHGAYRWWYEFPENTRAITDTLRERHGEDVIVQSNHPWRGGLAAAAQWSPGEIRRPDYWTDDFQAVEILNKQNLEGMPFYFDLINRGYRVTPVGVSDSHGYFDGAVGLNGTFLHMGIDHPREYSDEALIEVMRAGRVQVSRGIFLDLSILPGETVIGEGTVDVSARAPSWVSVDRLVLYRDGEISEVVESDEATFTLSAPSDSSFVVMAEGTSELPALMDRQPFAMSAAWFLDVDGDGWEAPLPPFELE